MKVIRKTEIDTNAFMVGDQIDVNNYMATCQKVEDDGYIFFVGSISR